MIQEFHRSRWINSSFSNFALRFIFGTFAERKRVVFFHFLREKNYVCAFMHYKVELYFHIFLLLVKRWRLIFVNILSTSGSLCQRKKLVEQFTNLWKITIKWVSYIFFYCLKIFQLHFFSMFIKSTSCCSRRVWTTSMFIKDYYFPLPVLPSPSRDLIDCSIPGQEKMRFIHESQCWGLVRLQR